MTLSAAQIASDTAQLGFELDSGQIEQLLQFAQLLRRWTKVHNLTAIAADAEMLTHHLLDSLAVVPVLRAVLAGADSPRLLDVGSGGGLPAVPLAIAMPHLEVVAIDKVGKKAAFLTQVRVELRLDNFSAVHARVEAWQPPRGFDVVIARAFGSLGELVRVTRHLLVPHGLWLAMKGQHPEAELAALARDAADVRVERVVTLRVPRLAAERHLVLLRPANLA